MRLLKLAAAAVVLAAAFTGAAQANLGLTGSQGAPLAPVSSVVTGVSTTLDGTVEAATAPTNGVLGDSQAPAAQAASTLDATVAGAVGQVQSTLDTTVDDTLGAVQTTLDAPVGGTLSSVEETVNQITGATLPLGTTADLVAVPATSTLTHTTSTSPVTPVVANASAAAAATQGSAIVPAVETLSRPGDPNVGRPPASYADSPVATPRQSRTVHVAALVARGVGPALTGRESQSRISRTTTAPRPPEPRGPAIPVDLLSMILQGANAGGLLVSAALLALITLLFAGGTGPRLRPVADLLPPPDVFFRLERPG
jgi:hypothetical protein